MRITSIKRQETKATIHDVWIALEKVLSETSEYNFVGEIKEDLIYLEIPSLITNSFLVKVGWLMLILSEFADDFDPEYCEVIFRDVIIINVYDIQATYDYITNLKIEQ